MNLKRYIDAAVRREIRRAFRDAMFSPLQEAIVLLKNNKNNYPDKIDDILFRIKNLEWIPRIAMLHGAEETLNRLKGQMVGISRIYKYDPIKNKLLSLISKTIRNVENASNQKAPSAETLHRRSLEFNGFEGDRGRELYKELIKRARDIRKKERDLQYYNK